MGDFLGTRPERSVGGLDFGWMGRHFKYVEKKAEAFLSLVAVAKADRGARHIT
jgi:hypothetical protein